MDVHPIVPTADVARKFLALIDQQCAHLSELYDSGRWKLYYSDDELRHNAHELNLLRDKWAAVAALGGNGLPALRRWGGGTAGASAPANHAMATTAE
jgi:hypothetical protein